MKFRFLCLCQSTNLYLHIMDETTEFKSFLESKKIDADGLKKAESALYQEWSELFSQVSPASFTSQKLFLINPIRRKYPLSSVVEEVKVKPKMAARAKFKKS